MEEKKEFKLFREKSLESIESPESLNDYLRVTSPGVWLVLLAVIALLIGGILWSVLGRISTTAHFAVTSVNGETACLVPYSEMEKIPEDGTVTVNGRTYALSRSANTAVEIVSETTNPYIRVAGKLNIGDVVVRIPLVAEEGPLPDGVYTGDMVTESLRPISLLLH